MMSNLLSGQYERPVRIVAFSTAQGWAPVRPMAPALTAARHMPKSGELGLALHTETFALAASAGQRQLSAGPAMGKLP